MPARDLDVEPSTASATELSDFVTAHIGELIHLDVTVEASSPDDLTARRDKDPASLTIPSPEATDAQGVAYRLADVGPHTDSSFYWDDGFWHIEGYFTVRNLVGPQMGIFTVNLRAVPITEVAPGAAPDRDADRQQPTAPSEPDRRGFVLPSGNIFCLAEDDGLRCDMASQLQPPPEEPCDLDWTGVHLRYDGPADPVCAGGTIIGVASGEPVLAYGETWRHHGIRCHSERTGLTCRNDSDVEIFLSREDWHIR